MIAICRLIGHRRSKRHVRPYRQTWRSECRHCGLPLMRDAPGVWRIIDRGAAPTPAQDAQRDLFKG